MSNSLDIDPNEPFPQTAKTEEAAPEQPKVEQLPQVMEKRSAQALRSDDRGILVGGSLEEQYRLAKAYCASGLMPKGMNSPERVLVAFQLCRELNLPFMSSVGKIMVVNGTPAIWGDLPLALAYRSKQMEQYQEVFEEKDGKPYASTCTVKRKGMEVIVRRFTVDDARAAGLFRNDIWAKYTKRMLQCRARAWALKDALADVLMGVSILEYDHNATVEDGRVVGGGSDAADALNKEYFDEGEGSAGAEGRQGTAVPGLPGAVGPVPHQESGGGR
jgi:hypothetical protein